MDMTGMEGAAPPADEGGMITMRVTREEAAMIEQMRAGGGMPPEMPAEMPMEGMSPEMQVDQMMKKGYGGV